MKVQFINEPVSVEALSRGDGTSWPQTFAWRGQRFRIESWGRESTRVSGERTLHCLLVQTAGHETWELCQDAETAQWTLARRWAAKDRIA